MFTVLFGENIFLFFPVSFNVAPRLCPSFTFWPHCVFEFYTPVLKRKFPTGLSPIVPEDWATVAARSPS